MQTVILCGGLGTRLREETEFRPKPMVNIGTRPILWHIMKTYASYGHSEFVLALGYKGDMVKEYFWNYEVMNNDVTLELGNPEKLKIHACHGENGWKVTLSDTGAKTLKGGRIKRIEKYITDDVFMLTYGDGVGDVDIDALVKFHKSHGKIVTLTGINPAARFGEMMIDGDQVTSFREKPEATDGLVNGGYLVCNRKIFDYLRPDEDCDFEYGPLEKLAKEGQLMVYKHTGFWACMDTLRDMDYLNGLWDRDEAPWKIWGGS